MLPLSCVGITALLTSIWLETGPSKLVKANVSADPFMLPPLASVATLLVRNMRPIRLLSVKLCLKSRLLACRIILFDDRSDLGARSLTACFGIYVLFPVSIDVTSLNILLGALLVTMLSIRELVLGPLSMTI